MSFQAKNRIRKRRIDTHQNPVTQDNEDSMENQDYIRNTKTIPSSSPINRLKLMPIKSSIIKGHTEPKNKNRIEVRRAKSHLGNQVQLLKGDISRIRHQIMANRSKKKISNYVVNQTENLNNDQIGYSPTTESKRQLFKPFWKEAYNKKSGKKYNPIFPTGSHLQTQSNQNSLYQSQQQEQNQQSSLYFPIIEKTKKQKHQSSRIKERAQYSHFKYSPQRLRQYFDIFRNQRNQRARLNMSNFRKVAHAVLFTIYLRKFNERMRQRRKNNFNKFITTQLKNKLLQIKELLIEYSKPFFTTLTQNYNFDFCPNTKDDSKLRKQKLKYIKKLVNMQIQCLKQAIASILTNSQKFAQLIYYLCRHGSFSCFHNIYTSQQINLMCISEYHGYLRAQKQLQRSAIVSLIFIKLLLYNVLMDKPLLSDLFGNVNGAFINKTIVLVGNILYQLFIDIQDELLEKAPSLYKIGNWQELKHRMNFALAQNMSIKQGFFQKNQLISGLEDHKIIIDLYGTKQMTSQKLQIRQMIKKIHKKICNYHDKVRQKSFIK